MRLPRANFIAGPARASRSRRRAWGQGVSTTACGPSAPREVALQLLIERGLSRVAFGKPLVNLGGNRERIADLRIAIDQARLLTMYAAWKMDEVGALAALTEISAIKVVAPSVLQQVVDEAIQIHGGAGVSFDVPLTALFANARVLRIVDGPDAVHRGVIARMELGEVRRASPGRLVREKAAHASRARPAGTQRRGEELDTAAVDRGSSRAWKASAARLG